MHHQRPAQDFVGDTRIVRWSGQMVGRLDEIEEEHTHRGQDASLVGDHTVEYIVECRDPVSRDEQQVTVVDAVQLADFATGQVLIVGQSGTHRDSVAGPRCGPEGPEEKPGNFHRAVGVTTTYRPTLCWDRGMKSRFVPYATTPGRLLAQLFSDIVVAVWTFLWVLVGLAVHSAVSTIAEVGREFVGAPDGVANSHKSAGESADHIPLVAVAVSEPLKAASKAALDIAGAGHNLDSTGRAARGARAPPPPPPGPPRAGGGGGGGPAGRAAGARPPPPPPSGHGAP